MFWLTLLAAWYALASLATFAAYGWDKAAARAGRRRLPERTLHRMELAGGWPGALAGQRFFRHKRAKETYMIRFVGIVALHAAAWCLAAWLYLRQG